MRKIYGLLATLLVLNSCAYPAQVADKKPKKASPGLVKKVTGSQSARPYAPGQQKKRN